jgi:hypothetical protein
LFFICFILFYSDFCCVCSDVYCPNCGNEGHHIDFPQLCRPVGKKQKGGKISSSECYEPKYEAFVKFPHRKFFRVFSLCGNTDHSFFLSFLISCCTVLQEIDSVPNARRYDYFKDLTRRSSFGDQMLFPPLARQMTAPISYPPQNSYGNGNGSRGGTVTGRHSFGGGGILSAQHSSSSSSSRGSSGGSSRVEYSAGASVGAEITGRRVVLDTSDAGGGGGNSSSSNSTSKKRKASDAPSGGNREEEYSAQRASKKLFKESSRSTKFENDYDYDDDVFIQDEDYGRWDQHDNGSNGSGRHRNQHYSSNSNSNNNRNGSGRGQIDSSRRHSFPLNHNDNYSRNSSNNYQNSSSNRYHHNNGNGSERDGGSSKKRRFQG